MLKPIFIDKKGIKQIGITHSDTQLARMERKKIETIVDGRVVIEIVEDPFPQRIYLSVGRHRNNKPFWPLRLILEWCGRRGAPPEVLCIDDLGVDIFTANDNEIGDGIKDALKK